jgi:lysozyme
MSNATRWLQVSAAMVAGLMARESLQLVDFPDPANPKLATACYGRLQGAKIGTHRTKPECDAQLREDLNKVSAQVSGLLRVKVTQGQFDALVDFAYNAGITNLANSSLLRYVNAGNFVAAGKEFNRWVYANGKDCRIRSNNCFGLIERRQWETALFVTQY